MKVGELFAGVGGIGLGLERAGMEVVWQVEKDDFCRRVLAEHWPDVRRYEDVKDVGAHNLEPVDLICGGFPCQDLSYAGKGAGIDGERSGLWAEYARIIRELRPRFVLVENVPALLTRGLGRVIGDLAASGYDAEWSCIPAAAFGAPHLRWRVFIIGHSDRFDDNTQRCFLKASGDSSGVRGEMGNSNIGMLEGLRATREQVVGARPEEWQSKGPSGGGWDVWTTEPDVGRVAHGVPNRVDRLRALGNAVVPQVAEYIGHRIMRSIA